VVLFRPGAADRREPVAEVAGDRVRISEVVRVLQVPDAVREDQCRLAGREHHAPEGAPEHEQRRKDPVRAQPANHPVGAAQVVGAPLTGAPLTGAPLQPVHRSTVTASTGPVGGACRYCQ